MAATPRSLGYGSVDQHYNEIADLELINGRLVLEDGETLTGISFGAKRSMSGEVVFNTGMVGYPESLTDPSYCGQILVLTYPLVGNYGVPNENELDEFGLASHFESNRVQITGLIICDYSWDHSHYAANTSLATWLKKHDIPALYNIDTRHLTKKLRSKGSMLGKIEFGKESIEFEDPNQSNLVQRVSRTTVVEFGMENLGQTIICVDCGIKNNIIRYLVSKGVHIKVVPWDYDFLAEEFDGLFISNGPGDPTMADVTIANVRRLIESERDIPIFGICLGHQVLALAAGATTYKMKFGNRGMNQPVIDLRTSRCYISPQNHGFAVDDSSLPPDWKPFFRNANDYSNEGIIHEYRPMFSVQFHPEARGGPTDTEFLFDMFLSQVRHRRAFVTTVDFPKIQEVTSVLLLGSGGLSIGQAGEFDYSGSQAIKALKEENVRVILINPNIATVQTSANMADEVYFLPVTPAYVKEVILKENPDALLLQFGGQTALNCGIALDECGFLAKHDVKILGTPVSTIIMTEDRGMFAETLAEINEEVAPSSIAVSIEETLEVANKLGYPVLLRAAFALGGLGSGFASNPDELRALAARALSSSRQVIVDRSLRGWKEVEYEVVRDGNDNCITVCNMENFDPLGIHTGDSIVVAPSQTLSNEEYFMLRQTAIKVVRHLGVVGECNIQYALDPYSSKYYIIEVNARLSRSSALASKATGYPLAYVAAKLALGRTLPTIKNSITKATQACFEPSLDYCVVKFPRWDMRKFSHVSALIGSSMKSVGEVMAIDRKFEAAFSKALRMVNGQCDGFGWVPNNLKEISDEELIDGLRSPSDERVYLLALAVGRGFSVEDLHKHTFIDRWFLCKLRNIAVHEKLLTSFGGRIEDVSESDLRHAKQLGFSDDQIARLCANGDAWMVRNIRESVGITPFVKQVDTLAAEFPAQTNYLYMTYMADEHDLTFDEHGIIVLGCGAYRIGSSCEFDWCAVNCVRTLRECHHKSIVINYNPETVSTDYDECDRLYFEELSFERVLDIYSLENSSGVIVSVGGQISNNLAVPLDAVGCNILGTQPSFIDNCENRHRFSALLDRLRIDQPRWSDCKSIEEAARFANMVGYPVLIRPSYVLSGAAMNVAYNEDALSKFLNMAVTVSPEYPVVISKFIANAKEIEMDAVAADGVVLNYAISEHVENAGVHSGDATLVLPAQNLYMETFKQIRSLSKKIAHSLKITGPFNIQFLAKDNHVKVIECNLRASRSFPFVSKALNVNLIDQATRAMIGNGERARVEFNLFDMEHVCVKAPMFSFTRLLGADPTLRVEMASTGEVACFGHTKHEAILKALMSANFKLPNPSTRNNILISIGPIKAKHDFYESCVLLNEMGYNLFATKQTHEFLTSRNAHDFDDDAERGLMANVTLLYKPSEKAEPSVLGKIGENDIHLVINIPRLRGSDEDAKRGEEELTNGYHIRRKVVDFHIPLISNLQLAKLVVRSLYDTHLECVHDALHDLEMAQKVGSKGTSKVVEERSSSFSMKASGGVNYQSSTDLDVMSVSSESHLAKQCFSWREYIH